MKGNGAKNTVAKNDVELVLTFGEGWGAAFRRLREDAGHSQRTLADEIGCDQSAIAHWEAERFKPQPEILRKALEVVGADPRVLFRHFQLPPEIRQLIDAQLSPEQAAIALGKILLDSGSNEQALGAIFDFMSPKVMASVSIKALHDVQAAKLFFERQDKHKESQLPQRRLQGAINVTPAQFLPPARPESQDEQSG